MKKLIYLFIASLAIISCTNNDKVDKGEKDMSAFNRTKMQAFYDQVMNAHNPAMTDSFCTPDIIDHQLDPHYPAGIEGVRATFKDFFTAFPDMNFKTNFINVIGDTIIAQVTMTGTNSGSFMGMPPTNKKINVEGVDIVVVTNGKAKEHWGYAEDGKMMAQLGMGGPPPPPVPMEGNKK